MKNKILSVGIVFTFLLMAACSNKGGEVTALNPPPGPDVAKPGPEAAKPSPEQIPSIIVEEPGPTDQPTGITIPPRVTSGGTLLAPRRISPPTPTAIPGTGPSNLPPFPGVGPTFGGGITGGTGTTPPVGTEPSVTAIKIETKDAQDSVINTYPVNISQPSSIPAVSIPTGFKKIVFTVTATDPGNPSFTYNLKKNLEDMGSNSNGVFTLDTSQIAFNTGEAYSFKLSVTDSETPTWLPNYNIPVTIVSAGTSGGGTSGGTGGTATNQPPTVSEIKWETTSVVNASLESGALTITHDSATGNNTTNGLSFVLPADGAHLSFTITATDPEHGNLTYSINYYYNNANHVIVSNNTGQLVWPVLIPCQSASLQTAVLNFIVADDQDAQWKIDVPMTWTCAGTTGGSLDPQFDEDGKLLVSRTESFIKPAKTIVVQNNGEKFVVAGTQGAQSYTTMGVLLRFFADGRLDTSFGTNGSTFLTNLRYIGDITTQADGKIIVAGGSIHRGDSNDVAYHKILVSRLTADGKVDPTFPLSPAPEVLPTGNRDLRVRAVAVLSDGKILLAGYEEGTVGNSRATNIVLWRFNSNGTFDNTFFSSNYPDGILVEIGSSDTKASGLLLQGNKIIVAGSLRDNPTSRWKPLLLRLNENGTSDTTFGSNGYTILSSHPDQNAYFTDMVAQTDEKLVAVGTIEPKNSFSGSSQSFAKRFDKNGIQETNFGDSGDYVIVERNSKFATSVALQTDGSILIGGSQCSPTWYLFWQKKCDFRLQRLTTGGIADETFGPNHASFVTTDMGSDSDGIGALTVLPNGKILAVGVGGSQTDEQTVLAITRYNP